MIDGFVRKNIEPESLGEKVKRFVLSKSLAPIDSSQPVWDIAKNHHRTEHGGPMVWARQPYLPPLYKMWPAKPPKGMRVVIKKVPQEGISELALCVMFTYAGEFGARMYYVLPKYEHRNRFVSARVDKSIAFTERYKQRLFNAAVRKDGMAMKHFGRKGIVIFPSSNVRNDFISFGVDIAIIDEVNECVMDNVALVDDRMAGFDSWRVRFDISTPTLKSEGISPMFDKSDQRHWFVPCDKCGEFQILDWWENVVERSQREGQYVLRDKVWVPNQEGIDIDVYCKHCGDPMSRHAIGEWRPTRPGRPTIGFHMSKLYSGSRAMWEIWEQYLRAQNDPTEEVVFFNSYLGEDYSGGNVAYTLELLDACSKREDDGYIMPEGLPEGPWDVAAGIDVGKFLHIFILLRDGSRLRSVHIGTLPNNEKAVEEVIKLLNRYRVTKVVMDADPETNLLLTLKSKLNEASNIRFWSCRFQQDDYRDIRMNASDAHLTVDRTYSMDQSLAIGNSGELLLPHNWRSIGGGEFADSMCGPTRVREETTRGPRWRWSSTKDDHYRLALTYAWLATTLIPPRVDTEFGGGGSQDGGRVFTGDVPEDPFAIGAASGDNSRFFTDIDSMGRFF